MSRGLWHALDSSKDILEHWHGSGAKWVTLPPGYAEESHCREITFDCLVS